jgi:hypothetical protein
VSLLFFVPGVNVIYLCWILAFAGDQTANQYGPIDEPHNGFGKITGTEKTYGRLPY